MNKVKVYESENGSWVQVRFDCPGCKCSHSFTTKSPTNYVWTWNGSLDKPTFSPSLLCNKDYPEMRCHSFVTDGKIQFLGDCFHKLKNQTVELPDYGK